MNRKGTVLMVTLALMTLLSEVRGHGRLMDPPARSSMWRKGFMDVPKDYSDNELYCGGFTTQWQKNGGKCGVCGDPYGGPYNHELGGKFFTDKIAATYAAGQTFTAQVELTASHKGWFEFRLCKPADRNTAITHHCLDQNLLQLADGSGSRYPVTRAGHVFHDIPLTLPAGLTCDYCVLQWKYHTGNSWGTNPDGSGCLGCGAQEEFYGCSNIAIDPSSSIGGGGSVGGGGGSVGGIATDPPKPTAATTKTPVVTPHTGAPKPETPKPPTAPNGCRAADGPYKTQAGIDAWCKVNCAVGFCPPSHCTCGPQQSKRELTDLTGDKVEKTQLYKILKKVLEKVADGDN